MHLAHSLLFLFLANDCNKQVPREIFSPWYRTIWLWVSLKCLQVFAHWLGGRKGCGLLLFSATDVFKWKRPGAKVQRCSRLWWAGHFPQWKACEENTSLFWFFFSSAIKQLHVRVNSFYMLIRCYILIEYRSMLALPTDAYHAHLTSNSFKRHASQSQPCIPCGTDFSGLSACCCTTYHILCFLDWSYVYSTVLPNASFQFNGIH